MEKKLKQIFRDFIQNDEAVDAEVTSSGVMLSEEDCLTLMMRTLEQCKDQRKVVNISEDKIVEIIVDNIDYGRGRNLKIAKEILEELKQGMDNNEE